MLTSAWTPLKPHPLQVAMWRSKAKFIAAACGRGSGKSTCARRYVVRWLCVKKPWPDPRYFYALPTQDQARLKHWDHFKNLIPKHWIAKKDEVRMVIRTIYGSTISLIGLDKAERAEGDQYDGGVIDECSDVRPKVFERTFLPTLTHRNGWCWRIGVPKRFGRGAREFHECCVSWAALQAEGHSEYASYNWPSSDILPPETLEKHAETMDPKDFAEQYGASWETVSGLVYYGFDKQSIAPWKYDPALPIIVGSDFNVSPMAWVLLQMTADGVLHAFDELWLMDTNTQKAMNELHRRYGSHKSGWWFFGDATGRNRDSTSDTTDYLIIRNDLRFKDAKIYYPTSNPNPMTRVASVNWALQAANGKRNLLIDKKCLHLIKDLEYLAFRENSREIDERDKLAKHITDALGYVIHFLKPMRVEGQGLTPRVLISEGR